MIIIKNGALVTPQGLRRADLAMEGDKIVRIAAAIEPGEGDTVEDAAGCWVFPGFVDGHTHMQCWTGMDWTADSFETGTRAAACGGTTTIVAPLTPTIRSSAFNEVMALVTCFLSKEP